MEEAIRYYNQKLNQKLPSFKRYIFEEILNSPAKLTAIYGSRGVGKTTLMMQVLKRLKIQKNKMLYISCDYPYMQGVSLYEFVEYFAQRGGEVVFIDEVQEAKNFEQELKMVYDLLDVKMYFTGSSAISLKNPDLARRYSMYHLAHLSFREFVSLNYKVKLPSYTLNEILKNHENIAYELFEILPNKKILQDFEEFLLNGIYPFYFEDKSRYIDRINDTIEKILHIDLSKIYSILPDKIDTLKKLLATVCVSEPFEFTMDNLASKVGITKATLYKYLIYLDKAELIKLISHEAKRYANIRKSDKIYLANTNLSNAICINKSKGTQRETYFLSMLYPMHKLNYVEKGDFLVDEKYTFEIGGKNKGFEQIKDLPNSYVVADDIEIGFGNKIPLWLFGFLY